MFLLFFSLFVHAAETELSASAQKFQLWEKAATPFSAPYDSVGTYTAGCLLGGEALPLEGDGYVVMRTKRLRYFGGPELIAFLQKFSGEFKKSKKSNLLIGDMGRPRGGPMISGHISHQIGLDVDIWFRTSKRKPKKAEREIWGSPSMVGVTGRVNSKWKDLQRDMVLLAAAEPEVDRIFVNPAIKLDLCKTRAKSPWIMKIRPWWGHDSHFHVRLKCPANAKSCKPQDPIEGDGCDSSLDWWFSQEARDKFTAPGPVDKPFPELPEACSQLVKEFEK